MAAFADRFPVAGFLASMGLPDGRRRLLRLDRPPHVRRPGGEPEAVEQMTAAWGELAAYWTDMLADRRANPLDPNVDFLTMMSQAEARRRADARHRRRRHHGHADAGQPGHAEEPARLADVAPRPRTPTTAPASSPSPSLIPSAVEEFLRAYPIVSMARKVTRDVDFHGCPMKKDDMVLLTIQAATRDPRVFPDPEQVQIDRSPNRHIAFGASEHRCIGSHLARAELRLAIEEWLRLIPEFEVDRRRAAAGQGRPGVAARAAAGVDAGRAREATVKPPPFDYHRPDDRSPRCWRRSPSSATTPRCSPAGRAWCRCSTCAWPASTTSSTSAGSPSWPPSSGATATSSSAPACATGCIERDPAVAAAVPLLRTVDAVHRPLPDPQPGHDRRLDGPRRPGRRVPGGGGRARRHVRAGVGQRHARRCRPTEFFTGFWSTALEADELLRAIAFPVWSGRAGFGVAEFARRHGDFAIAGAVAAIEVDDGGVDQPQRASTAFGVGATPVAVAAAERARRDSRPADVDAAELAERAVAELDDVTDDPQVPAAYRRRVGVAVIADAWRRAVDDHEGSRHDRPR